MELKFTLKDAKEMQLPPFNPCFFRIKWLFFPDTYGFSVKKTFF